MRILIHILLIFTCVALGFAIGVSFEQKDILPEVPPEHVFVELYDDNTRECVFMCVLEKGERYLNTGFPYPLKMSAVSLTMVRNNNLEEAQKEAKSIRIQAGWDLDRVGLQ